MKKKNGLRWFFTVFVAVCSLSAFTVGGIVSGLLFLFLAFFISPFRIKLFEGLPEIFQRKEAVVAAGVIVGLAALFTFPGVNDTDTTSSFTQIEEESKVQDVGRSLPEGTERNGSGNENNTGNNSSLLVRDYEKDNEEEAKKVEEEAVKKAEETEKKAEEEAAKKAEEEAAKKKAEEEAQRKAEEEAAKRKAEEEAQRKAEEEAAKKKAEEEAAKKAEEEAARKKAEEEAQRQAEATVIIPVIPATSGDTAGDNNQAGNASNFDRYYNPEQQNTESSYVLNTNTNKFHYPHCHSVSKIKPENYATSNENRDVLIAQGYSPCGNCNP